MKNLNPNILITGTSSGIGLAIANHLKSRGYNVIGTSRNPKPNDYFPQLKLDITDDASVEKSVKTLKKEYGTIDVLINNAGIALAGSLEDTSMDEAINQLDTNYFGVVRMIKAIVPIMKSNNGGKIINIGSMAGLIALPFQAHYSASKYALEGLVEALRFELKPFNIEVCNINPGDFKTELTANRQFSKNLSQDYKSRFEETMKIYIKSEEEGPEPTKIAMLAEKLIEKKSRLKMRYVVGNFDQTIVVQIKRLLGAKITEGILSKYFKL